MTCKRIKKFFIKTKELLLLILAAIICVAIAISFNNIQEFYLEQLKSQSLSLSSGYAKNLETALTSNTALQNSFDNKIITAGKAATNLDVNINNNNILSVKEQLNVDVINVYNSEGVVLYSSVADLKGTTSNDEIVNDFTSLSDDYIIDKIKIDNNLNGYFKYGYFKMGSNRLLQIGLNSDEFLKLLEKNSINAAINNIQKQHNIILSGFIDNDNNVTGIIDNVDSLYDDATKLNTAKIKSIKKNEEILVITPIFINGEKVGSLITGFYNNNHRIVNLLRIISIFTLVLAFAFIVIFSFMAHKKDKKIVQLVYFDQLTGLPNKKHLVEALKVGLKEHQVTKSLILISFKNIKMINTTYGYKYCELIIKRMAQTLSLFTNNNCQLYSLSNDKMAFYFKKYRNNSQLSLFCEEIIKSLINSFPLHIIEIFVGVVELNHYKASIDDYFKYASIAANNFSDYVPYGYCFFNKEMEEKLQREQDIKSELNKIIREGENNTSFYLNFQPIYNIKNNEIFGFEALARLKNKSLGNVSPLEFIPIAESTQLIIPLGNQILRMACKFVNKLYSKGYHHLQVSVNISIIQLLHEVFISNLMGIINEMEVSPSNISIEITESIFSDNYEAINEKLSAIKKEGIKIAIDDFGTGYSSLAREEELNIDYMKIDKHFINKLVNADNEKALTKDIISMGHKLGHMVIAEGVEFEKQIEYLKHNNCDCIQGFIYSKPLTMKKAIELLNNKEIILS